MKTYKILVRQKNVYGPEMMMKSLIIAVAKNSIEAIKLVKAKYYWKDDAIFITLGEIVKNSCESIDALDV